MPAKITKRDTSKYAFFTAAPVCRQTADVKAYLPDYEGSILADQDRWRKRVATVDSLEVNIQKINRLNRLLNREKG